MRNISSWAIRNPVPPVVLFMLLMFLGLFSFMQLPITNSPDVSFPLVHVEISQPGGSPTELDTQVTQIVEGAVASVGNVRNLQSVSLEGQSSLFIEFRIGTAIDRAVSDVRDAVSKVRAQLPEGIEEPQVNRVDIEGGAIAYYAVATTDMSLTDLSWFVDNGINKRLLAVNGVAQVSRSGGVSREIRIDLDPARLQALGITAAEVNRQLRTLNLDSPGGRTEIAGSEQAVRVLGGAKTADALSATRIKLPDGRVVRLADIANVYDGYKDKDSMSRLNGRLATSFGVFRAKGSSDVAVKAGVEKVLDQIRKENPKVSITQIYTSVDGTIDNYHSAIEAILEGSALAVLVVWLFLRDWRATAISALAIPLSAIPAFWLMDLMGFTLNFISLLSLALVAGILVDDAIVEIENIVRHMNMGKTAYQAALEAADEIGLAVVATTFAIIAVFLPVSFMGGISGQYFKQFGLTVAAAVFMSLLVARLITPMLAAYFLKPHGRKPHASGAWMRVYLNTLRWSISKRSHAWLTIGGGLLFFVAGIVMFAVIPKAFNPPQDDGTSTLRIELAPGARLEDTARASAQAAAILRAHPQVISVFENIGASDNGEARTASLNITLTKPGQRKQTAKEIEQELAPKFRAVPDARINFQSQNGGFGRDITIVLAGDDPQLLDATSRRIINEMKTVKGLRDPRINGDLRRPEIVIRPRHDLAAELGVSTVALGQTLQIATIGDIPQNLAKFSLSDRQVPIRVSLIESARQDLATLENLPVPTASGASVPLKAVADISFGQGPTKVRRYNQSRRLVLECDLDGITSGQAQTLINNLPSMKNLPNGIRRIVAGNEEFEQELITNFVLALATGTLMVFSVIMLLYRRVFQPLTNMGSLLLAPGGAMIALLVTGNSITLPVYIGILMLFGIVAKNSILLIDFAIEEMRRGVHRDEAILEAGHKRAQPIIMTTVAMVAGMMPIALGLGADASFRGPMAISVIGGLITSTILTLLIIPAAFTIVDDIEQWFGKRASRLITRDTPLPAATPAE